MKTLLIGVLIGVLATLLTLHLIAFKQHCLDSEKPKIITVEMGVT